jgi:hypothetical protein
VYFLHNAAEYRWTRRSSGSTSHTILLSLNRSISRWRKRRPRIDYIVQIHDVLSSWEAQRPCQRKRRRQIGTQSSVQSVLLMRVPRVNERTTLRRKSARMTQLCRKRLIWARSRSGSGVLAVGRWSRLSTGVFICSVRVLVVRSFVMVVGSCGMGHVVGWGKTRRRCQRPKSQVRRCQLQRTKCQSHRRERRRRYCESSWRYHT